MAEYDKNIEGIPARWEPAETYREMVLVTARPRVGDDVGGQVVRSIHRYVDGNGDYAFHTVLTLDRAGVLRRQIGIENMDDEEFSWSTYPEGVTGHQRLDIDLEPYNARHVAHSVWVAITDSELDADTLMGCGHVATASPLGMGRFAPEWIARFAGKDVRILPGNSVQSRIAAYRLSGQLLQVCACLNILTVPYRPDELTLADFLGRVLAEEEDGLVAPGLFDEWVRRMVGDGLDLHQAIARDQHLGFQPESAREIGRLLA